MLETELNQFGGKGAEVAQNAGKEPFKCRHRWALVSKAAIRNGKGSIGALLVQTCRKCGSFRVSAFEWLFGKTVQVVSQVRYVKSEEGVQAMELKLRTKGEGNDQ